MGARRDGIMVHSASNDGKVCADGGSWPILADLGRSQQILADPGAYLGVWILGGVDPSGGGRNMPTFESTSDMPQGVLKPKPRGLFTLTFVFRMSAVNLQVIFTRDVFPGTRRRIFCEHR